MVVNIGILGTGKIAQDFAQALKSVDEAKLIAIGSRSKESALNFGKDILNLPENNCYGSYEELVKVKEIDLIYVASPHSFHYEHCLLCINNNKNIICEKALSLNSKQAKIIIDKAKEKQLFFMEAFWTRYMPSYDYLTNDVIPKLGTIRMARVNFGFKNPNVPRLTDPLLGGGAILDIGVYTINFCCIAYNDRPLKSIYSVGNIDNNRIDHDFSSILTFDIGNNNIGIANTFCTISATTPSDGVIIGENGYVIVHEPFWCPTKISVYMEDTKQTEIKEFPLPEDNTKYNYINSSFLQYEARYACQQIQKNEKESKIFGTDKSLYIMNILDKIREQLGVSYPNEDI